MDYGKFKYAEAKKPMKPS
ncbi:MAG: hypothetical protein M5R42_21145 [Rhodocyclaceae bacterium]|nr:hypothetical protein [Rhodocyclaceae bacterium]